VPGLDATTPAHADASTVRRRRCAAALAAMIVAAGSAQAMGDNARVVALPCVELDPACPALAAVAGLALTASPPADDTSLAALLRSPPPASGVTLARRSGATSAWVVAAGPLQAAEAPAQFKAVAVDGQSVTVDLVYRPYSAIGPAHRRFVPSYPVAVVPLPSLPAGQLAVSVRWSPEGPHAGAATVLGPLSLTLR
jgi:hypothetical protein